MHYAGYGRLTAIIDISHCTGNSACGGNTTEKRSSHVGNTLSYQFGIGVVFVTDNTVGYGSRKQGFYGSQYSNRNGNGE